MVIKLQFCNIIVRVETILEKLGEDTYQRCYRDSTDTSWNDGQLFRDGCMNESDLTDMLDNWEDQGFELIETIDGQKHWKDVCVANSGHGPSYPCEWIEHDAQKNIVWLKGKEPGEIIGSTSE